MPSSPSSPQALTAIFLLLTLIVSRLTPASSAACTSETFSSRRPPAYDSCLDLPALDSRLHWSYDPAQSILDIAFAARPAEPDGWVSWAINPTGQGMVGSQALAAFRDSNGRITVRKYNVSSYGPLGEESTRLWYNVKEASAEFSGGLVRLFATLALPEKGLAAVNHVWQTGGSVTGGVPDKHAFGQGNLNSMGRLDLLTGQSTGSGAGRGNSRAEKRNVHGVLNVISWGILFPIGIVFARYLRIFPSADPAWFYLHVSCQVIAYAIGVAGWATGLKLGSESEGVTYSYHRNIGITLFVLATMQVFALVLRPKKDHKYRLYWNIYHHGVGYTIVALSLINVFKGFDILRPEAKWRNAYLVVIVVVASVAALLEVITWIVTLRRKKYNTITS
ncbi:Cytochrome b561 and DOMON domain-containing protein [Striga hermonthica]|uniref:Cytochrome b561 and DOMON domain-containing protein n=1 Tax=Striga hermonthica TaxID=68872 RepID=A0A9N7NZT4_STRHE|nr:Cytochrome b561 and DOMON domain-containing protein [Striga hermonthica]